MPGHHERDQGRHRVTTGPRAPAANRAAMASRRPRRSVTPATAPAAAAHAALGGRRRARARRLPLLPAAHARYFAHARGAARSAPPRYRRCAHAAAQLARPARPHVEQRATLEREARRSGSSSPGERLYIVKGIERGGASARATRPLRLRSRRGRPRDRRAPDRPCAARLPAASPSAARSAGPPSPSRSRTTTDGRPFPTTYYLTCPHLVAAVSRLEAAGGVERWSDAAAADPELHASLERATGASARCGAAWRLERPAPTTGLARRSASAAPRDRSGSSACTRTWRSRSLDPQYELGHGSSGEVEPIRGRPNAAARLTPVPS